MATDLPGQSNDRLVVIDAANKLADSMESATTLTGMASQEVPYFSPENVSDSKLKTKQTINCVETLMALSILSKDKNTVNRCLGIVFDIVVPASRNNDSFTLSSLGLNSQRVIETALFADKVKVRALAERLVAQATLVNPFTTNPVPLSSEEQRILIQLAAPLAVVAGDNKLATKALQIANTPYSKELAKSGVELIARVRETEVIETQLSELMEELLPAITSRTNLYEGWDLADGLATVDTFSDLTQLNYAAVLIVQLEMIEQGLTETIPGKVDTRLHLTSKRSL